MPLSAASDTTMAPRLRVNAAALSSEVTTITPARNSLHSAKASRTSSNIRRASSARSMVSSTVANRLFAVENRLTGTMAHILVLSLIGDHLVRVQLPADALVYPRKRQHHEQAARDPRCPSSSCASPRSAYRLAHVRARRFRR